MSSYSSAASTRQPSTRITGDTPPIPPPSFYAGLNNEMVCLYLGPGLAQSLEMFQREPADPHRLRVLQAGAQQEATRRGLLSAADWEAIRQKRIRPGLSRCALFAIAGLSPTYPRTQASRALNITAHSYDCRKAPVPYCPYTRVDVDAERIISIAQTYRSPLD
jgi:hypothetical protein